MFHLILHNFFKSLSFHYCFWHMRKILEKRVISDSSYWNSCYSIKIKTILLPFCLNNPSTCERNRIWMEVALVSRWYLTSVNFLIVLLYRIGSRVIWKGVGNEKRLDRADSGGLEEGGLRPGGTWRSRPWIVELYIMCRDISTVGNLYRSYNILERTGREGGREGGVLCSGVSSIAVSDIAHVTIVSIVSSAIRTYSRASCNTMHRSIYGRK